MKRIVFTGGGTAGHIMPNIAIIERLKNFEIYYIGSNGMEKEILNQFQNVKFIEIPTVKLIRKFTNKNLLIPFKLFKSIKLAKEVLKEINPDIIFSKGGYVSIPTCLAGKLLKIPILTHESDISIGLANKIIARISKHLCCSFEKTAQCYKKNAIYTGSPIRQKILNGNAEIIKSKYQIRNSLPTILIVGGSLGAQSINNVIFNNIEALTKYYNIIHIVGKNNMNTQYKSPNYHQVEFAEDIENYFAISDIVISRAGSNTIFELLALNKPMILIPLPKSSGSRGDQELNSDYFRRKGFAEVIKQEELNIDVLTNKINSILFNKHKYINCMKKLSTNNGSEKIIDLIQKSIS